MAVLALQIGIVLFAVRFFGRLAKKIGIPQVLGELIAGIVIGPYALGSMKIPGFPNGIFSLGSGTLAVSNELYAIASIASIILLFASGL
ncbi:cation:proton antiporter domain-containing protein, partial [Treponema sp. R6D11]